MGFEYLEQDKTLGHGKQERRAAGMCGYQKNMLPDPPLEQRDGQIDRANAESGTRNHATQHPRPHPALRLR